MANQMFCFQCEQTAGCKACTGGAGVCGKKADTAVLQDNLTGSLIGLAHAAENNGELITENTNKLVIEGLFTTNCLMPPKASYSDRVFTTEVVSYPEMLHIGDDKDFTPVIEKALALSGYPIDMHFTGINGGQKVMTGFSHSAVLSVADTVIEAVNSGAIKHFFLVGGCDGAKPGQNYYTEFVKQTPTDSIVLTLACGKYRFNDLDLGTINGLPRIMDMGQCNDAYSAIKVAVALAASS